MSHLRVEQTGPADCRVWAGEIQLAEIRNLRLSFLRLRERGAQLVGTDVPLPLFWEQYADHENPERNTSSGARVSVEQRAAYDGPVSAMQHTDEDVSGGRTELMDGPVSLLCRGTTASGSVRSVYRLTFARTGQAHYDLLIHARFEVVEGLSWLITPNPHHGEIEFCNLWPAGSFSAIGGESKRYTTTAVRRGEHITLIPHNHLESAEKHNIPLHKGDRIAWLLEDENPVLTLESEQAVSAGLCAYMWDMHLAYKVCEAGTPLLLPPGCSMEAHFRLASMSRTECEHWLEIGRRDISPEDALTPVYVRGVNTFRQTIDSSPEKSHLLWPWVFQAVTGPAGSIRGEVDRSVGFDDSASVSIRSTENSSGRWVATTLGPAFGDPEFRSGRRFRLSARVRTLNLNGQARIALRLHRTGSPDLHRPDGYEEFAGVGAGTGTSGWQELTVVTPPIVPEPDRIHLHLFHEGSGTSWFDNVLFEEID